MTENMTVEDFTAVTKKTFHSLPGEGKLAEVAKVLYQ